MKLVSLTTLITLALSVFSSAQAQSRNELLNVYDQLQNHENRISVLEQSRKIRNTDNVRNQEDERGNRVSYDSYRVVAGDSINLISSKLKVRRTDLLTANKLQEWSIIHPGQMLKVPVPVSGNNNNNRWNPAPEPTRRETQQARVGENTLYSLARSYGTSVDAIKDENPGLNEFKLRPDMLIRIPVSRRGAQPIVHKSTATSTTQRPEAKITTTVKVQGPTAKDLHKTAPKPLVEPKGITPAQPVSNPALEPHNHSHQTSQPVINRLQPLPLQVNAGEMDYTTSGTDTWETVAKRFNTTTQDLRQRNGSIAGANLIGGIPLRVPGSRYSNDANLD